MVLKNQKHDRSLMTHGFVKFSLLTEFEVGDLLEEMGDLCSEQLQLKNVSHAYNSVTDLNLDKKRKIEMLIRTLFANKVEEVFDDFRLFNSFAVIKQPGGGNVVPHQHPPIVTDLSTRTYILWCPLVDVDTMNGRMHFVEGSQNIIPGLIPYAYGSPYNQFHKRSEMLSTPVETRAGECIVFDENILHWSEVNVTKHPRIAVASTLVPESLSPVFYHFDGERQDYFEVFSIDDNLSLNTTFSGKPIDRLGQYPSLGFVKNEVVDLSEEKFVELLETGGEIIPEIRIIDTVP